MKITYVGGSPSREVAGVECKRGEPVELRDDLALHLLRRTDWQKVDESPEPVEKED